MEQKFIFQIPGTKTRVLIEMDVLVFEFSFKLPKNVCGYIK